MPDNNTVERTMRPIALGRKNYLFVGSEPGGKAAAIAYTLIETAKLNAVDPNTWLADTFARTPDHKITKVDDLMPWHWNTWRTGRTVTWNKACSSRKIGLVICVEQPKTVTHAPDNAPPSC